MCRLYSRILPINELRNIRLSCGSASIYLFILFRVICHAFFAFLNPSDTALFIWLFVSIICPSIFPLVTCLIWSYGGGGGGLLWY